jgi:hypothetical protein
MATQLVLEVKNLFKKSWGRLLEVVSDCALVATFTLGRAMFYIVIFVLAIGCNIANMYKEIHDCVTGTQSIDDWCR